VGQSEFTGIFFFFFQLLTIFPDLFWDNFLQFSEILLMLFSGHYFSKIFSGIFGEFFIRE